MFRVHKQLMHTYQCHTFVTLLWNIINYNGVLQVVLFTDKSFNNFVACTYTYKEWAISTIRVGKRTEI